MKENKDAQSTDEILAEMTYRTMRRREWRHLLFECVLIVLAVYLLFHYVIGVTVVKGDAMEPYLYENELVIFYRLEDAYRTGDVVVVAGAGTDNVRLVVGDKAKSVETPDDGDTGTGGISEDGFINIEDVSAENVAGRVVLHVGFQ